MAIMQQQQPGAVIIQGQRTRCSALFFPVSRLDAACQDSIHGHSSSLIAQGMGLHLQQPSSTCQTSLRIHGPSSGGDGANP